MKTLSTQVTTGRQSVSLQELVQMGEHKLRVQVRSDTYKFQNVARVDRWDGRMWQLVWAIPAEATATQEGLVYHREGTMTRAAFAADVKALLDQAKTILS